MWKKIGKFIAFLPITLAVYSCSNNNRIQLKVDYIYDGDTFISSKQRYRMFGIDAPELKDKNFQNTKGLQREYALKAKNFLDQIIFNKNLDNEIVGEDKYKRKLVKSFLGCDDIAKIMLESGLARVAFLSLDRKNPFFTRDQQYYDELLKIEYQAKITEKGFWKYDFQIVDKEIFK